MALSGHPSGADECPLLGVKRTSGRRVSMSAFDPKRTLDTPFPALLHPGTMAGRTKGERGVT
jgi:hypothetical protein